MPSKYRKPWSPRWKQNIVPDIVFCHIINLLILQWLQTGSVRRLLRGKDETRQKNVLKHTLVWLVIINNYQPDCFQKDFVFFLITYLTFKLTWLIKRCILEGVFPFVFSENKGRWWLISSLRWPHKQTHTRVLTLLSKKVPCLNFQVHLF